MKSFLSLALWPAAALTAAMGAPLARLWSFSRLQQGLGQRLHPSCVVLGTAELRGSRRIRCGANLYLYRELYLETQNAGVIEIGDHVVLSRGVHLVAHAGIRIGAGTMIGEYASVRDANHHHGSQADLRQSGHQAAAIDIGRHVWIGRGAIILPGVRIGDHAVIGANAVVRRDVAAGTVVVGVPASPVVARKAA